MAVVVDTSVVMACILEEPGHQELLSYMQGKVLVASASLPWEIGNGLAAGFKRGRLSLAEAMAAFEAFQSISISLHSVDFLAAIKLCHTMRIYAYDAYMLQRAIEFDCSLLSIDRGLNNAARGVRIPLVEIRP